MCYDELKELREHSGTAGEGKLEHGYRRWLSVKVCNYAAADGRSRGSAGSRAPVHHHVM